MTVIESKRPERGKLPTTWSSHRDAERHHADQRRDADRDAERGERGAQHRLAQVPQREPGRVGEHHDPLSTTSRPSSQRERALRAPRRE